MWGAIAQVAASAAKTGIDFWSANKSIDSQTDANNRNLAFAREQLEYQKELNRNQIQWKVEDAKKAGLHPMAALGLSPMSFSPVSGGQVGADYSGFNGVGQSLSDMGQNIDRAVQAGKDREEREAALDLQQRQYELSTRHLELQNDIASEQLKQMQINTWRMMANPMASTKGLSLRHSIDGQANSLIPGSVPGPSREEGEATYQWNRKSDGSYERNVGNDIGQLWEDKSAFGFLEFDLWPMIKDFMYDMKDRISGNIVDGMIYVDTAVAGLFHDGWYPVDSAMGQKQLEFLKRRRSGFRTPEGDRKLYHYLGRH